MSARKPTEPESPPNGRMSARKITEPESPPNGRMSARKPTQPESSSEGRMSARRYTAVVVTLLAVSSVAVSTYFHFPWWVELIIVLALGLYALLEWYERFAADAKQIALVATLSALAAVGRTVVQAVPGVQPATFIVIASGYAFGPVTGAVVGVFTAVGSDLFLGEGGWTPWHVVAWGCVGLTSGLLRYFVRHYNRYLMAAFGVVWGYVFGWMMNTWLLLGGPTVNLHTYFLLCVASFWFDTLHAVSTGALLVLLGQPVHTVMQRFRHRMKVTRLSG